ncbi:MAG: hypothetical protein N3E40_07675, partial [Dehalococcoidia bacterium]|nr:hypothetical protein [Dehalococcoidia bacterium]
IFAASMSAGEMLKIPVPFPLPTAPPEKNVYFPDLPPGFFISMSYSGLLLKYGVCAEPFRFPKVARVLPEDMDKLRAVATRLRDAYFFTKEINIATIRRS